MKRTRSRDPSQGGSCPTPSAAAWPARQSAPPHRVLLIFMDAYDAATHLGVVEWVREHDWALEASTIRTRELPRLCRADGIVLGFRSAKTLAWMRQFGCPIVRLFSPAAPELLGLCRDLPAVESDFQSAGSLGAAHLLTLGHPHFVFYQRGIGKDVLRMRDSFVAAIRAAGHEPSVFDFTADHPARNVLEATPLEDRIGWLAGRMRRVPKPMAIMVEDDRFVPDVMEAARLLGLRVPTDVAVLGCDDNRFAHGVSPIPISSVDSNNFGVGYAAADLVGRLAAGEKLPAKTHYVAARRVVARQSTATYAGGHPGLNLALRHVRQHFRSPLQLEAVARIARMSVRGLQHAFRQDLGYTFQEELARLRVEAATQLLETTDLKLDAVAADTNLGDGKNLCRVFAKIHGMSPNTWRHQHHQPKPSSLSDLGSTH